MELLLLSSSKVGNSGYLEGAKPLLSTFFANSHNIIFVPYAGVSINWDEYTDKVTSALPELSISGMHQHHNPREAIRGADGVLVGGGNTFQLLKMLYEQDLIPVIREKVSQGTRYSGWSAGANIAGNSIRTTNDMPIVFPPSFHALQLVPFQLNPHYTEYQPPGHNGETREDRLREFMIVEPDMPIVGIPEGTALVRENERLSILGTPGAYLFANQQKTVYKHQDDLSFLLHC